MATSRQVESLEPRTLLSGWVTVDDFQLVSGNSAGFVDVATDSAGNVYAVGGALDGSGARYGVVREKRAGSDHWMTTSTVPGVTFSKVAVDAVGDVYVQAGLYSWLLLERPAGQSEFTEVDDQSSLGQLGGLAVDAAGNVYAAGVEYPSGDTAADRHWIVRKRTGGQGPFVTVDDYTYLGAEGTYAQGITVVPSGPSAGAYAVGGFGEPPYPNPSSGGSLVRKSIDGGATWTLVDTFDFDPDAYGGGVPVAVTADSAGNLYYLGRAGRQVDGSDVNYGFVRRSGDGGATWSTVDTFLASTYQLNDIGADAAGNVYVVGFEYLTSVGSPLNYRAFIRSNAGGTWQVVDQFQLAPNRVNYYTGFAADPQGNVYVAGYAGDAAGPQHGLIRSPPAAAQAPVVSVSSSTWSGGFLAALNSAGLGDGGATLPNPSQATADVLPWTNLNRIQVQFSGDSSVQEMDLVLTGANGNAYEFSSFNYDPTSRIATWSLAKPLGVDRLTLRLNGRSWRFDVLPADVDRSGSVNASDLVKVRNHVGASVGAPGGSYGVFFDLNGDGTVNAADLVAVRNRVGGGLPPTLKSLKPLFSSGRIAPGRR